MKRIEDKDLNIKGERFDSFDEMYRICESRDFNKHYQSAGDRSVKDAYDVKSNLKYSWEQTKNDIMYGSTIFDDEFRQIRSQVDKQAQQILSNVERAKTKRDVVGSTVSVERALVGHPQPFNHRKPVMKKQKTVHLMFNITCSWNTSTKTRLTAGCILMAITEILEKMDYQVAITYTPFFSYQNEKEPSMLAEVQIKDFKTRFNQRKIQFPVASESVLFHLGCWWHHRTPEGTSDYGWGEGKCVDYSSKTLENAKQYARNKKAIYLSVPMLDNDFNLDVQKTLDYVFDELKGM